MSGKFIVFDGPPGSGKSTMIKRAFEYIFDKSKKYGNILVTDEPTEGPHGKRVRELLKKQESPEDFRDEIFQAFWDDRKWHIEEVIKPALEKGMIVLCDRYKYSSIAYQSVQGTPFEKVFEAHRDFLAPDLALILDISPEKGLERTSKDKAEKRVQSDKFRELDFIKEVRKNFFRQKELFQKENFVIVDASAPAEDVFSEIREKIDKTLFQ